MQAAVKQDDLPSASMERMNLHHLTSLFQVFCLFVCSFLFLHPKIKMSYNLKKKDKYNQQIGLRLQLGFRSRYKPGPGQDWDNALEQVLPISLS